MSSVVALVTTNVSMSPPYLFGGPTGQGNDRGRASQQFANVRQGHRQSFLRVPTIYNFTSLSAYLILYPVQVWNWNAGGNKQAFDAMPAWHCQGI